MDDLSLWIKLKMGQVGIVVETGNMTVIAVVTVVVTMVGAGVLPVEGATHVANLGILLGSVHLVMVVEEVIGIVEGMIGMVSRMIGMAAVVVVVVMVLSVMETDMVVVDAAEMGIVVVGREVTAIAETVLVPMNALVGAATVSDFIAGCCSYGDGVAGLKL